MRSPALPRCCCPALLALALLATTSLLSHAASFQAQIEPDTIYLGESANLTLTFEGGQPDKLPALPRVANLTYAGGGREDRFTLANGRQTSTVTYRYSVLPAQAGSYVIPPLVVYMGGQPMASDPLRLTVLPVPQAGTRPGGQPPRGLLRIYVPRTNIFVGQVLPVELTVYAINPSAFDLAPLTAEGFTVGKSERLEQSREPLNGVIYTRLGMRTTVSPGKTGTLTLGPATGRVQVEVPMARRRASDPFDSLFNDPFFNRRTESQVLNLVSEPLTVVVSPLPDTDVPPNFTGAVGEYALEVRAAPTNVAVGEPIRLRIQLTGQGALDSLTWPSLDTLNGFRAYPAVSRVETTDTLGVQGSKIFEQDLVPENTQVRQVPPLLFAYFDPLNHRYVTLSNPPIPLIVRPAGLARTLAPSGPTEPPPKEIVHLKPRLGTLAVLSPPLVARPWFILFLTVPILAWLAALSLRFRREHLHRNPRLVRRHQVQRTVKAGLVELSNHARQGAAEPFFALVFRLLQEMLGERLDRPAASITEAVIEEHLRPRGVRPELTHELQGLFQACNQARYAPTSSIRDLQASKRVVERVLHELQGLQLT